MAQVQLHGDSTLAQGLRDLLRSVHPVAAVAVVTPAATRTASYGARLESEFEIGSLSKAITGLLYADALDRGKVQPTTLLGDLLPLDGSDAARVTLGSLATHASGLPRLPKGAQTLTKTLELWTRGTNPYGENLDELMEQARRTPVGNVGRHMYSNLGFELLGHAVAAASGTTYPELLQQRLTAPLGLAGTYVTATFDDLRPAAIRGRTRSGRARDSWVGEALAPAGGIRSTADDLARLTEVLLDGSAPGVRALDPVEQFTGPAARIGAGWMVLSRKGRDITWHNGRTGGFGSWWGMDRQAGSGVVILTGTSASVDRHGFELLEAVTRT
ncbi:MAG: serine hydrolase domain-containing protein [Candidatus Nanopelagicales bacterium]